MSYRRQGGNRLLLLIPLILLAYLGGVVFYLLFVPWFVIDVIWQITLGTEGLKSTGFAYRVFSWQAQNTAYVLFGEGAWRWVP